ncbi:sodium/hydrogen exchanger 9B2-like [Styela clava]|uniref:sodium/hydrogen exchanger 9B2-like n=1 Tax=Styela clava TaxID=7725 RepID=UPI00193AD0BC|nr:sodium/hydrogen exchanger 9B2-like [Styela clava]
MPLTRTTESSVNLFDHFHRRDSGVSDMASHLSHTDEHAGVYHIHTSPLHYDGGDNKFYSTENIIAVIPEEPEVNEEEEKIPCWKDVYLKLCPPRGPTGKWLSWSLICLTLFGMTWSLAPKHMCPNENIFGLFVTILLCFVAEIGIAKIPTCHGFPPLPKLLASLLMGVMLANLPPPVNFAEYIHPHWSWSLRTLALAVILTRAGLELDPKAMEKVKWAVVRLAFLPCLGETCMIGIFGHLIMGFPWEWSFMLGFLIAAVSPAVVIPSLILLQEKGLGCEKGVPSLVMAASGIDDVLAIAGFTVLLGIAMPTKLEEAIIGESPHPPPHHTTQAPELRLFEGNGSDSFTTAYMDTTMVDFTNTTAMHQSGGGHSKAGLELLGALVEVVIGIAAGLVCGFLISYVPPKDMKHKSFVRGSLLLSIGVFAVFASDFWGIPGSGALWALVTSFVASFHWKDECKPLEVAWHYMWIVFQPILFGLTGATVQVDMLDGQTVGLGMSVLSLGLLARMCVSTSVTWGLNFNLREKAFVTIAWIPKGTVQAALGSAALDAALTLHRSPQEIKWGEQVLVLAVLVTLITAPVGAFGISISGPKLLSGPEARGIDNHALDVSDEVEAQRKSEDDSVTSDDSGTHKHSTQKHFARKIRISECDGGSFSDDDSYDTSI